MTKLSGFVRTLPANWATCPIYAQGVELPKGGKACGKSPLGKTHHENWSPKKPRCTLRSTQNLQSSWGIHRTTQWRLASDVDLNPSTSKEVVMTLITVVIESPKEWQNTICSTQSIGARSRASALAPVVKAEVLWGRQGLVGGAYWSGGEYVLKGDVNNVPEAPGWLLPT